MCVPILASQIDAFDPDSVPTVGKLLLELEELSRRGDTAADWGKTSLRPYVELFEKHAEAVAKEHTRGVKGECLEAPIPFSLAVMARLSCHRWITGIRN